MRKNNKRALVVSALSLLLCVTMLVGSTFAWFTDNASTAVNTIQAGTLNIDIQDNDGNSLAGKPLSFVDSEGKVLTDILWEPGCTYILQNAKLVNLGNLALKFKVDIKGVSGDTKLAEVIDITVGGKTTTLAELMADPDGAAYGYLLPAGETGAETSLGQITLHMQESAGNDYQGLSLNGLAIMVYATQYTHETDSYNNQYDANATYSNLPIAQVTNMDNLTVELYNEGEKTLAAGYVFTAVDDTTVAQASPYRYYHADFVVSADKTIPANALTLAGYYSAYCDNNIDGKWLGLSSASDVAAGTEIRLLQQAVLGGNTYINYEELCSTVKSFYCGPIANDAAALSGTTITVELRIYEVEEPSDANNHSRNVETGNSILIGSYSYTFK